MRGELLGEPHACAQRRGLVGGPAQIAAAGEDEVLPPAWIIREDRRLHGIDALRLPAKIGG